MAGHTVVLVRTMVDTHAGCIVREAVCQFHPHINTCRRRPTPKSQISRYYTSWPGRGQPEVLKLQKSLKTGLRVA